MVNQPKWQIQGSRVFKDGHSFNCINIITAKDLQSILNQYETTHTLNQNIDQQYDNITKQIIQIQLSIGIVNEEIQKLKETIQCLSK